MGVVGIVQAHLGSSRLPYKALALIEGEPMTWHIARRLQQADGLDDVVLAIPEHDDALIRLAQRYGIPFFAGSEIDVIGRICGTASAFDANAIVRITGDCPFVDPDIVDAVVLEYMVEGWQYVCNVLPPTFPDGLDVELYSRQLLEQLDHELDSVVEREWFPIHVWENLHPDLMYNIRHEPDISHLRWTVDFSEDLEFAREVYKELGPDFRIEDVLLLLERRPELVILNEPKHRRGEIQ